MHSGAQVGAYRILEQLGAGGMGSVWLAEHMMLGRKAALKVLHADMSLRRDIVRRFFNEARAATAIEDPGIVQIFDFGYHEDGSAYIVMELLAGETLDSRLERIGTFEVVDALRIIRQIAKALGAAHDRGIIHRDLKPDNLFLVRDSEVDGGERAKILDFGIAKLIDDFKNPATLGGVIGTPLYMAPEQCRGDAGVDQRADVYALGCVLFQLLVGAPPFDSPAPLALAEMHMNEPAPAPSSRVANIPPAVDALVLRCLAKDPDQRFASAGELARDISSVLASLRAPTAPLPDRPQTADPVAAPVVAPVAAPVVAPVACADPVARTRPRWVSWLAGAAIVGVAAAVTWRITARPAEVAASPAPAPTAVAAPVAAPAPAPAAVAAPAGVPAPPPPAPEPAPPAPEPAPVAIPDPAPVASASAPAHKKPRAHLTAAPQHGKTEPKAAPKADPPPITLDENGVPTRR